MDLAPRKLGSFEAWLVALAAEARRRGHQLDLFGVDPVHADVAERLGELGVRWAHVDTLKRPALRSARRLAQAYDVLHVNLFAPRTRIALIAQAAWPARVIYTLHLAVTDPDGPPPPLSRRVLDRLSLRRVSAVVSVSEYVSRQAVARFGLLGRTHVIYNGVDSKRFTPPAETRRPDGPLRLFAAGNLHPIKGLHHLLHALAQLPRESVRLAIAGDGEEQGRLRDLAAALDLGGRVEFLGLRNDIPQLLRESDVFVHLVVVPEAFGFAIAEAMASGRAVVASGTGGIPELIRDGVSGLLVPPGKPDALAAALRRFVDEPALRARLGAAARAEVERRFTLGACVTAHLDLCERLAHRRAVPVSREWRVAASA